jgi:hypothetical protein
MGMRGITFLLSPRRHQLFLMAKRRETVWRGTVLRPAEEFFTYMEMSPLPVKGCKIEADARRSGPLSREGSLSCHTCCDMGPWFYPSLSKDHSIQLPLMTHKGKWSIYSNLDPHGSPFGCFLWHKNAISQNTNTITVLSCPLPSHLLFSLYP